MQVAFCVLNNRVGSVYGRAAALSVQTPSSPPSITVGARMNVLMPERVSAATIQQVTQRGYVFSSPEVDIRKVVGIASPQRAAKVATQLTLEPTFGPVPMDGGRFRCVLPVRRECVAGQIRGQRSGDSG